MKQPACELNEQWVGKVEFFNIQMLSIFRWRMGWDRGKGSNLSVILGGGGGRGREEHGPYNISESALFPAPSF